MNDSVFVHPPGFIFSYFRINGAWYFYCSSDDSINKSSYTTGQLQKYKHLFKPIPAALLVKAVQAQLEGTIIDLTEYD